MSAQSGGALKMGNQWRECRLGDLFKVKHGFAFKGEYFTEAPQETVLVTPGNFSIGGGFQNGKRKFYRGTVPPDFVLKPGQVVVTMTDLSKQADTLGYAAIIPEDSTIWLHNQRIGLLEFKPDIPTSPRFIHYLLRTREYRAWIVGSASGSTVKHTAPDRIESFSTRIPPLAEQQAIAHILGTLDDKIEINRRMNQTLENMAQALFQSWFVDFDGVPLEEMQESELGLIPKGWRVGTLADFCEINTAKWTTKKHPPTVHYIDLGSVFANCIEAVNEFTFNQAPSRARMHLREGDTIVGTVRPGNRAFAYIHAPHANLTASTGFAVLSPRKPHYSSLIYLTATRDEAIARLANLADGAAYPAVRPNVVAETPCVIAPDQIIAEFSVITKPLLERIEHNRQQSRTLATLRNTLLPKLLSGQLSIPVAMPATSLLGPDSI